MRTKTTSTICAAVALVLSACGGDSLDQQTANQAMMEAMSAGTTAYTNVAGEMGKVDGAWVTGSAGSFQVSGEVTSQFGGSATVTGSGSKSSLTAFKMDLSMSFKDWNSSQGLILNGTINLGYDVKSGPPPSTTR